MERTKVPREVWTPYNGPVQIQIAEQHGIVWVNSGKDSRCLIRICNIEGLSDMMDERKKGGPWSIDIRAMKNIDAVQRQALLRVIKFARMCAVEKKATRKFVEEIEGCEAYL